MPDERLTHSVQFGKSAEQFGGVLDGTIEFGSPLNAMNPVVSCETSRYAFAFLSLNLAVAPRSSASSTKRWRPE